MELLAIVQCTVYADVVVVLWTSTFSTFYSTCPLCSLSISLCICLCLHLCITVVYLSISLEVSVSVFLSVLFSFLLNFIWLILPSQASTFPLLVPYFLDSFFKYIFFFNWVPLAPPEKPMSPISQVGKLRCRKLKEGLPRWCSVVKNPSAKTGDAGSIPGWGRSPGGEKWQPTLVFLPGKSHGQRILVGDSPWGRKESDTTEWLNNKAWVNGPQHRALGVKPALSACSVVILHFCLPCSYTLGPRRKTRARAPTLENPGGSPLQARWGPFPLRRLEANHT